MGQEAITRSEQTKRNFFMKGLKEWQIGTKPKCPYCNSNVMVRQVVASNGQRKRKLVCSNRQCRKEFE